MEKYTKPEVCISLFSMASELVTTSGPVTDNDLYEDTEYDVL